MSYDPQRLGLVIAFALVAAPLCAANPQIESRLCNLEGERVTVHLGSCETDPVLAWPLIYFLPADDPPPASKSLVGCLLNTGNSNCILPQNPLWVMIAPLTRDDPEPVFASTSKVLDTRIRLSSDFPMSSSLDEFLRSTSGALKYVELAWRLGSPPDSPESLLTLRQLRPVPTVPLVVGLGTCQSLPVGWIEANGQKVEIRSYCDPAIRTHSSGTDTLDAIRKAPNPFVWTLTGPAPRATAASELEWRLFPVKPFKYVHPPSGKLPPRRSVFGVAPNDGSWLMGLTTPLEVTTPSDENGKPPDNEHRGVLWVLVIALYAFVAAPYLRRAWHWRQGRATRLAPPNAPDQAETMPTGPIGAPPHPEPPPEGQAFEARTDLNSEIEIRNDSGTEVPNATTNELKERGNSADKHSEWISSVEWRQDEHAKDLEELRPLLNRVEKLDKSLQTLQVQSRSTDLWDRLKKSEDSWREIEQSTTDHRSRLERLESDRIEHQKSKFVEFLMAVSDLQPVTKNMLALRPGIRPDLARPQLTEPEKEAVSALCEICDFSFILLAEWLRNEDWSGNYAETGSGLGTMDGFRPDLDSLRKASFGDRILFRWWLRRIEAPRVPDVLESALRFWKLLGPGQHSVRSLCLDWGHKRLPGLQSILEAGPRELVEDGPRESLRQALARIAEVYGLEDASGPTNWNKVHEFWHETFHHWIERVFRPFNIEYRRVRLYGHHLSSPDLEEFMRETNAFYGFAHSSVLRRRGLVQAHGTIVRVLQPVLRMRDEKDSSRVIWEGKIEFAEVPKQ